jgi:hypothetical protein
MAVAAVGGRGGGNLGATWMLNVSQTSHPLPQQPPTQARHPLTLMLSPRLSALPLASSVALRTFFLAPSQPSCSVGECGGAGGGRGGQVGGGMGRPQTAVRQQVERGKVSGVQCPKHVRSWLSEQEAIREQARKQGSKEARKQGSKEARKGVSELL